MNNIVYKYNHFLINVIVFAPFVAFFTITYLNMDFGRIMQAFSYLGVLLLLFLRRREYSIKFPKYLLFYLLFILYIFYSTFIRLDRDFKVMYLFSFSPIGAFNFMFIIENLSISKKHYKFLIRNSKNILIIAVLVIIIQQVFNKSFFVNPNWLEKDFILSSSGTTDRLPSIYSWISVHALGFGFVPVFLLIVEKLDKEKKNLMLWIISGIVFTLFSKSRWIMVNVLLVFFIIFIHNRYKVKHLFKYLIILPFIMLMSLFALNYVGIDASGIIKDRVLESNKKDLSQKSAGTRILAFKAFDLFYWNHPLFGIGPVKYGMGGTNKQDYKLRSFLRGRSSQIHVGYLSLFYMYGMIGGFFFLSFLFLILNKLYQNAKITGIWAPFMGFFGFALANLTLVTFSVYEMGLFIVLIADKYYSQQNRRSSATF